LLGGKNAGRDKPTAKSVALAERGDDFTGYASGIFQYSGTDEVPTANRAQHAQISSANPSLHISA
jgi:hypothetical protein